MPRTRQTIAVAGVGDLGKYICEELLTSSDFSVIVLSRVVHASLLAACQKSHTCKRLIPSEWIGDSETYPLKPDYYASTRDPFRKILRAQDEVEWTLFNPGWLADYFLPRGKTYISPIPDKFPVDPNGWRACIRGSGEEMQSWTCGREIGRAVVELCRAEEWVSGNLTSAADTIPLWHIENVTYVAGEWSTFNTAVKVMESHYGTFQLYYLNIVTGWLLPITHKPVEDIQFSLEMHTNNGDDDFEALELAQVEEMMIMGYMACPKEKTMRQQQKYFADLKSSDLEQLLTYADGVDFV
ncbi:hypothetical protein OEA41_005901 [Lepraria neglecta]|uniref:NmrA-like domain-containing protein n=1 Tax=Lepraria neglecta TaxID=209136 RepID=A0AAD9Z9E5_9LECA|nr:hypothetical protein OEA41_005901 [Lepraria neglecta]